MADLPACKQFGCVYADVSWWLTYKQGCLALGKRHDSYAFEELSRAATVATGSEATASRLREIDVACETLVDKRWAGRIQNSMEYRLLCCWVASTYAIAKAYRVLPRARHEHLRICASVSLFNTIFRIHPSLSEKYRMTDLRVDRMYSFTLMYPSLDHELAKRILLGEPL